MPGWIFSEEEAMNPRNVNDARVHTSVREFLCSRFRIFDAVSILDSYLVGELDDSISVLLPANSAILFLNLVAEFKEPFLAGCLDVPRRGRHGTIAGGL
jgi:hypothetical protein